MDGDTVVIIPALNEEASIDLVLNALPRERIIETIVVDNNSEDETAIIAKKHGATVLTESQKGYGSACLKGIHYAYSLKSKYIIFLDGDYSIDPKEITSILKYLDQGFDFVLYSRTLHQSKKRPLPLLSELRNKIALQLISTLFNGYRYSDLGSFRGVKTESLVRLGMKEKGFGWPIEMQIKAISRNLKIKEFSIPNNKGIGHSNTNKKFLKNLKKSIIIFYTIIKYFFRVKQ